MSIKRSIKRPASWVLAVVVLTAGLVVPASQATTAHPGVIVNADSAFAIPGEFVVVLKEAMPPAEVTLIAAGLVDRHGGTISQMFETFGMFGLIATDRQAIMIAGDPAVSYVQHNQWLEDLNTQQTGSTPTRDWALWNLDRIDQRPTAPDDRYHYGPGSVPIYVVDSGIRNDHEDFGGRVRNGFAFDGNYVPCKGHGTAVASIAAGSTYGAAKYSPIISVKVKHCVDAKTIDVIEGLKYIRENAQRPAVVNMSFGVRVKDGPLENAVRQTIQAGFTVVVAAGNANVDACSWSPGSLGGGMYGAITVGATDAADRRWTGGNDGAASNYGPCVNLYAPGADVRAASMDSPTAVTDEASGTSGAAPLVSAAAAAILAQHPTFSPAQVKDALLADATPNAVTGVDPAAAATRGPLLYIPPPDQPATATSSDLNVLFNTYGNQGNHWVGGDETTSVKLPDGRVAWFFGDTHLGGVEPDYTRTPGAPMVHNSIVVQQGNSLLRTIHGGTAEAPTSLVGALTDPIPGDLGWWPGEGQVVGDTVQVFYTHYQSGHAGPLSIIRLGTSLASFDATSLELLDLTPLSQLDPSRIAGDGRPDIGWGAAMVDGPDGYTYIYGTESVSGVNYLHVARVPVGRVRTTPYEFWTGTSDSELWSSDVTRSARLMTGVGASFSVKYLARYDRYALVTMDLSQPFTNRVLASFAAKPTGPFIHQTLLYQAPEVSATNVYVYNARMHPEQNAATDDMVVSYNVNSLDPSASSRDVRLYRPRFIKVRLAPPVDAGQLPDAPTNLTATSPADGQVRLSWTAQPARDSSTGSTNATPPPARPSSPAARPPRRQRPPPSAY